MEIRKTKKKQLICAAATIQWEQTQKEQSTCMQTKKKDQPLEQKTKCCS